MGNTNDYHDYKLGRILLSVVGLWVYDKTWFGFTRRIFSSLSLISGVVFQLTIFVKAECNLQFILKILPFIIFAVIFITKHTSFLVNTKGVRKLTDQFRNDWAFLKNDDERRIVEKFNDNGKFINLIFASLFYPALVGFIIHQFLLPPITLATFQNTSIIDSFRIQMEYLFVDAEQNHILLLLHINSVIFIGGTTVIGTEITVMLFAHHVCGLFHVVCYRMQRAFDEDLLSKPISECDVMICTHLIDAVKMHKRTLQFCECLGSTFAPSYFVLLMLGVACMSLHILRFATMDEIKEQISCAILIVTISTYLFLSNYMGQLIIDSSSALFWNSCDTRWYAAPLRSQKMYLFILSNSIKNYVFLIGGLFSPSYEGFSVLSRLSISYFMVIYSAQK